jgi:hypothetical protein
MDATRPISAPGILRLIFSPATMITRTAAEMATVQPFAWESWWAIFSTRPTVVVPPPGSPSTAGSWRRRISMPMPARIPVTTGVEMKSAIHPSRSRPMARMNTPTIRARKVTRCS